MIAGIVVTAGVAGSLLDPFSPARLVAVAGGVVAVRLRPDAARGLGRRARQPCRRAARRKAPRRRSCEALAQVWAEPQARRFTIFVFVSMLAYSAQDLILEPFAGLVFGLTPGESTKLVRRPAWRRAAGHDRRGAGRQLRPRPASARCAAGRSAAASPRPWRWPASPAAGFVGPAWPLRPTVFALGVANGAFAVAAIGSMMGLAGEGREAREGVRMGLWGAAQAIAFGLGGLRGHGRGRCRRAISWVPRTSPTAPCSRARRCCSWSRPCSRPAWATPRRSRAPAASPTAGARYAAGLGGR